MSQCAKVSCNDSLYARKNVERYDRCNETQFTRIAVKCQQKDFTTQSKKNLDHTIHEVSSSDLDGNVQPHKVPSQVSAPT